MQVTVSLTVDLDASGGINALEEQVVEPGRAVMQQLVRQAVQQYEAEQGACPQCGQRSIRRGGSQRRVLLTRFGRVALRLQRRRCRGCGTRFRPADGCLCELGGRHVTAVLAQACVLAGISWAYGEAAQVVRDLCGAQVSAETVRALTNAAGQQEVARQTAQAHNHVTPTAAQVRAERGERRPAAVTPAASGSDCAPPAELLVGLDGGWIPSRDQPGGMEGQVGVVAGGREAVGQHGRHRLCPRRSVATFGRSEQVGELADAAATALGAAQAPVPVALGDGAAWIKTQVAWHFPDAVRILDWPPLTRAVHKAIRAARPGAAHRALRRPLHQSVPDALWQGDVDGAVALLAALRPAAPADPIGRLEETIGYLDGQRAWIGNYQAWQEAGYPIGSGLVERAVELVINRRLQRRGMRWWRINAQGVTALRICRLNGEWEQHTRSDLPLVA
jgi:Transposase, Mutator family